MNFKGSAFTDIDKWLETRRKERPDFVIGEVASGVVGLLNNKGGRLVIGVLEQKRYTAPNRRAWIENEFPDRSETDLHIAIGVDHEVSEINGKKDFDLYLRRLQDKLKSSIIPNPEPYITITSEPVGPFGKFRVVVIEVRIPGHEFWVKEGRQLSTTHVRVEARRSSSGRR